MIVPRETPPIVFSPFANERMREWPIGHYRRLIELTLAYFPNKVVITGTRVQRARANDLVRGLPSTRVINTCGTMPWPQVVETVDRAYFVVANNSGIAHLAAAAGRWVLCLFAGSHAFQEWMPRGPKVVLLSRVTDCSPCEVGAQRCPNGIACMTELGPDSAFQLFLEVFEAHRQQPENTKPPRSSLLPA
jgi:heptosyltransferase-2